MAISVGPFDLIEPLGSGGMGAVWRGIHREQAIPVAIKALTEETAHDPQYRAEFEREVQAVAGLTHPGIISVYDYGTIPPEAEEASQGRLVAGSPMLAMELADHGSLTDTRLAPGWTTLRNLLLQLLDALGYAHARGVIHRDVKPTNILLASTGRGYFRYKLTDFGIAHAVDPYSSPTTQEHGIYRGSPDYSPPEQLEGSWRDFGPWTDMYALGCVAYEFATGRPPFIEQNFVKLAIRHMEDPPPPIEARFELPRGFETWVHKLLAKEPEHRFRRAADAAWALLELSPKPTGTLTPVHHIAERDDRPAEPRDSIEVSPTRPPKTDSDESADANERDDVEQMATVDFSDSDRRAVDAALSGAEALGDSVPSATSLTLPHTAWLRADADNRHATAPPAEAPRPPLPPTWRRDRPAKPEPHLIDAGLDLFGLREVAFVGRETERDTIWEALDAVADENAPRAVVIRGPSGAGKSRLAHWMCQRAHEVGAARVLSTGYTPQSERGEPLKEMLEQALRSWGLPAEDVLDRARRVLTGPAGDDERLDGLARAVTSYLRPATSGDERLDGAPAAVRTERERQRVLIEVFRALGAHRPLVIWLDDIPWGVDALGLVDRVLEEEDLPVLFLMTARDACLSQRPTIDERLDELARYERVTDMELGPLSAPNHAELIEHLLTLSPRLAWQVEQRTAGNPLFAIQLVRDWVERDLLVSSEQGYRLKDGADASLPENLQQLCRERLERFLEEHYPNRREEVRQLIEAAAALGRRVDRTEWRTACKNLGLKIPDDLVSKLVRHRIARRQNDGFRFVHGALREVIAHDAKSAGRWDYHQQNCILMLEELYGLESRGIWQRWGEHLCSAGRHDEALEPFLAAATAARRAGDCPTAIDVLERIDEIIAKIELGEDARRVRAWLERAHLAREFRDARDREQAEELIERAERAAEENGWLEEQGLALLERGRSLTHEGRFADAVERFAEAHDIFEQHNLTDHAVTALLDKTDAQRRLGRFHRMFGTLKAIRRLCGPNDTRHRALIHEPYTCYYLDGPQRDLEQAIVHANRFLKAAKEHLSPVDQARAWRNLGEIRRLLGRFDEALEDYRRAYALSSGVGHVGLPCVALFNIGLVEFERGRADQAGRWFRDSRLRMERHDCRCWMAAPLMGLAACEASRGDWAAAESSLEAATHRLEGRSDAMRDLAGLAEAIGRTAAKAGRTTLARRAFELGCEHWQVMDPERAEGCREALDELPERRN